MAKNARYCVPFRRRREGKTDYKARKALILSFQPRLVVRKSRKNILAQIISATPTGDKVLVSAQSRELLKHYGWKAGRGNLPTAYLTGLLCGLKAKTKKVTDVVLDIGLNRPSKGAKVFAVLKGALDAGLNIPHGAEKLPDDNRLFGKHIVAFFKTLTTPDESPKFFTKYLERGFSPEQLPEHFSIIKKNILESFKGEQSI